MKGNYEQDVEFETKFSDSSKWRDLPFLLLFAIHFVGIATILGLGLMKEDHPNSERLFNFTPQMAELIAILAAVGFVFSLVYLQLVRSFPKAMIYLGMALTVVLFIVQAVYCFLKQYYIAGGLLAVFTLVFVLYLFIVRSRIPFAIETITCAVGIVQRFPGTQVTAFVSLAIQILWSAIWVFTLYQASTFDQTTTIIMLVFLVFSFYWVMEVIKNVVHVTVSGIVATWYFLNNTPAMPESPTYGALKRAMTTSFGSICLGSLIVAIIKTLRAIVRSLSRNNGWLSFIALCFLGCLDSLVRYFNHYAFCQIAIYGKTFCQAATDSWDLFQRSGVAQLANDNIIGGILVTGSFLGALVVGTVGALIGIFTTAFGDPLTLFLIGLAVGFVLVTLTMQLLDSAVSCIFVCYAEAPEALKENNPGLFQRFVEADSLIQ